MNLKFFKIRILAVQGGWLAVSNVLLISWFFFALASPVCGQIPLFGDLRAHDPSTMIKADGYYYIFRTGRGIPAKRSTDMIHWVEYGEVFAGKPPGWTTDQVRGFSGYYWAPDVVRLNGVFYLYYAISTFGRQVSSIGLATCTNLSEMSWVDHGEIIHSTQGSPYNCIDPSILSDTNGSLWMTFGSYWSGIYLLQLDPATGKRIANDSPLVQLACNSSIEASCLCQHGGFYYLLVNYGTCCAGIHSTYKICIGRSPSITGPFVDRNGGKMLQGNASLFLDTRDSFIGPGHAGIMEERGTNWFTFHYYDGHRAGKPTLGLAQLAWAPDGWPELVRPAASSP